MLKKYPVQFWLLCLSTWLFFFSFTLLVPELSDYITSLGGEDYKGATIFGNFNRHMTDESYVEKFPYVKSREVILRNVTTTSGKKLRLSDNPYMFKDVKVNTN